MVFGTSESIAIGSREKIEEMSLASWQRSGMLDTFGVEVAKKNQIYWAPADYHGWLSPPRNLLDSSRQEL